MNYRKERKSKYKRKLTLTNGQLLLDPYGTVENWMSDEKLMPDISWGDMYNYLSSSPLNTLTTTWKLKKQLEAFNFFVCNHVQAIFYNEIAKKTEFCSIKTKLQNYLNIFIKKLFQSPV